MLLAVCCESFQVNCVVLRVATLIHYYHLLQCSYARADGICHSISIVESSGRTIITWIERRSLCVVTTNYKLMVDYLRADDRLTHYAMADEILEWDPAAPCHHCVFRHSLIYANFHDSQSYMTDRWKMKTVHFFLPMTCFRKIVSLQRLE